MSNFAFNHQYIDHQVPHAYYHPHHPPPPPLPPHYYYYPYQPPQVQAFQPPQVVAPPPPIQQHHQQQRRPRRPSGNPARRPSRNINPQLAAPAAPLPPPVALPAPRVPAPIAAQAETPSPESHSAFVFGWDFSAPDEDEEPLAPQRPLYTPSPRSTHSDGRLTQQHELPSNPRPHNSRQAYDAHGRPVRPTLATNYAVSTDSSNSRTPLENYAYGVVMQIMEGTAVPEQPGLGPEPQQLSELHRRLFPPNCHFSPDGMGPH